MMHHDVQINGVNVFKHIYAQNPLLALIVRYFVTGDKRFFKQAQLESSLGAIEYLFRFGTDDVDATASYETVKKVFLYYASLKREGFKAIDRERIDVEDWLTDFLTKKVYGGKLHILPEFSHDSPEAHLRTSIQNFIVDKIRQYCNKYQLEVPTGVSQDDDDWRSEPSPEPIPDPDPVIKGDEEYMMAVNRLLELHIDNIRHRIAFLFKDIWGTVPFAWYIPESWTNAFAKKLRFDDSAEVRQLFDQLLIQRAELGMTEDQFEEHRDTIKEKLFKVNAETVERYFRLGRAALIAGRTA